MTAAWYRWDGDALVLSLKVQPRAKRDEFVEPCGDAYKVRITAPPLEGKANRQLIAFLADSFGVARSQVTLENGDLSRHKRFRITRPRQLPLAVSADHE